MVAQDCRLICHSNAAFPFAWWSRFAGAVPSDELSIMRNLHYSICLHGNAHGKLDVQESHRVHTSLMHLAESHPTLSAQWHPRLNRDHTPQTLAASSSFNAWWQCEFGHQWQRAVRDRVENEPECPDCAREVERLAAQYLKSLEVRHPELCEEWHPTLNGTLEPSQLAARSTKVVWWRCRNDASHKWQAPVRNRIMRLAECPHCAASPDADPDVANSLASEFPGLAKLWHAGRNLPMTPSAVPSDSTESAWWRCPRSATHLWQAPIRDIVQAWESGSNGCPHCAN